MQTWKNSSADIIFYDMTPAYVNERGYIVRLSEDEIEVTYDDDEGAVCYRGKSKGSGHFELHAPERDGKASLHCFPDSQVLEGYWQEGGTRGMWRIRLG